MGLSDVISDPDVRAVIDSNYSKPPFDLDAEIQATPISDSYDIVGGSFPYLFSTWCIAENADCYTSNIPVAEAVDTASEFGAGEQVKTTATDMFAHMRSVIENGILQRPSYQAAIDAYRMEVIAYSDDKNRIRHAINTLGSYTDDDIEDLRNLYETIPKSTFLDASPIYTKYQLDTHTSTFPGINVDLVTNGTLYDFTTTQYLKLDRDKWRELIAYATLYDDHRQQTDDDLPNVTQIGIYFARYGVLWETAPDYDILHDDIAQDLPTFLAEHAP